MDSKASVYRDITPPTSRRVYRACVVQLLIDCVPFRDGAWGWNLSEHLWKQYKAYLQLTRLWPLSQLRKASSRFRFHLSGRYNRGLQCIRSSLHR